MYKKIKIRFGVDSDKQMLLILLTFALTGSTIAFGLKPLIFFLLDVTETTAIWKKILFWFLFVFPAYYVCLLLYGSLLGQYNFFIQWISKKVKRKKKEEA